MSALTAKLRAYWRMEESGTGTRNDATAGGYNLTNNNGVTQAATALQGAGCTFAGGLNNVSTNQYFSVPLGAYGSSMTNLSLSLWIKPQTLNQGATAGIYMVTDGTRKIRITMNTTGKIVVDITNAASVTGTGTSAATLSTAAWWHIVITYTKFGANLYINGVFDTFIRDTSNSSVMPFLSEYGSITSFIGRPLTGDTTFYYYKGDMDEVSLYSDILDGYDIFNLYNNGTGVTYATTTGFTTDPITLANMGVFDKGMNSNLPRALKVGSLQDNPLPISGQLVY